MSEIDLADGEAVQLCLISGIPEALVVFTT